MSNTRLTTRALAIDPTHQGFAWAVFEGPDFLLDCGTSHVQPKGRNALCLRRIAELIAHYAPEVVVLEAYDGDGSHRQARVRFLLRSIAALAARRGVRCRSFSRARIRRAFSGLPSQARHPIATEIARRFPELSGRLPGIRKCWQSEDERMSIFDAASLALVWYGKARTDCTPASQQISTDATGRPLCIWDNET